MKKYVLDACALLALWAIHSFWQQQD